MIAEAPGPLDFQMLLQLFGEKMSGTDPEETIMAGWHLFDPTASGEMNVDAVKSLLCSRGVKADRLTEAEAAQMFDHLGNLGLGKSVGLDTAGAKKTLDGIDVHLTGGGGVEQVPSGHDGLLGVGAGHLLTEKLEEHLEVEGAGGLGDHGAQGGLIGGLAHDSMQSDKVIDLNDTVSILIQESEDLLELFDQSLIEHLEGWGVGAWVRRGLRLKSSVCLILDPCFNVLSTKGRQH